MEKEVLRINQMFRAAAHGKPWHGDSVFKVLENLTSEQAAKYPIKNAHSIWEILVHIINWRDYTVRTILDDEPYIVKLNTEKDWTTITDFSEDAWQATIERYKKSTDELSEALSKVEDSILDEIVPEHKFSLYTLLHGIIQHDIYHSGQIVMLRKLL